MTDLIVQTRSALLDALEALGAHRTAIVIVGAQAVYLRAGGAAVALAEFTKDSDLVIDPRELGDEPLLESAMKDAGFQLNPNGQPGQWLSESGIPVDLMTPEALIPRAHQGSRSAEVPPHNKMALRLTRGLEACVVDHSLMQIRSLGDSDRRVVVASVAGPAALMIAKLHKLHERLNQPNRLNDKDAHDLYRLLVATETVEIAAAFFRLSNEAVSQAVTDEAVGILDELFGHRSRIGAVMAGRAEEGVGDPEAVATSVSILALDLLDTIRAG